MARKVKYANPILCEYIIQGIGNKPSLLNVYSGDIVIQEIPATLRLAFYCEYTPEIDDAIELSIDIRIDGKIHASFKAHIEAGSKGLVGMIPLNGLNLTVVKEVVLEVTSSTPGERAITLLKKRISQGDVVR